MCADLSISSSGYFLCCFPSPHLSHKSYPSSNAHSLSGLAQADAQAPSFPSLAFIKSVWFLILGPSYTYGDASSLRDKPEPRSPVQTPLTLQPLPLQPDLLEGWGAPEEGAAPRAAAEVSTCAVLYFIPRRGCVPCQHDPESPAHTVPASPRGCLPV